MSSSVTLAFVTDSPRRSVIRVAASSVPSSRRQCVRRVPPAGARAGGWGPAVGVLRRQRAYRGVGVPGPPGGRGRRCGLAGMRLRSVADQVREELSGHRQRLDSLVEAALESLDGAGDPAAVEAELAREEYRRREADRAQEHRDRVAELRARIDDLTHAGQRET